MKTKKILIPAIVCAAITLSACGAGNDEPADAATDTRTEASDALSAMTEESAMNAVIASYQEKNPGYETGAVENDYWDVSTEDEGEIVVLYHSYTGAINRYYIDPATGNTIVTEFVPGIIDDEQETGESFNINDYL